MDVNNEKIDILKWMLGQIYRAEKKKRQLDERLQNIADKREAPIGGAGYKPLPRSTSENGDGAASILFKLSDIEERIYAQKEEIEKAIVRVMDIIEYLPPDSLEREICELRHIDMKPWQEIQDEIPMSRSQCNKRYNKALNMLLNNGRILRMVEDSEEDYTDWKLNKELNLLKNPPRKSSKKSGEGIRPENKAGKSSQKKQRINAEASAQRMDRRKKKGTRTQIT